MVCIVGKLGGLVLSNDTGYIHMVVRSAMYLTCVSIVLVQYSCRVKILSNVGISSRHIHQSTIEKYLLSCCQYFFQDSRHCSCVGIRKVAADILRYAYMACLQCSASIYFCHSGMHAIHCPRTAKTSTTVPSLPGPL